MCAGPKYFAVFISNISSGAKDFESYLNKQIALYGNSSLNETETFSVTKVNG